MKFLLLSRMPTIGLGLAMVAAFQHQQPFRSLTPQQEEILSHMRLFDMMDDTGNPHKTLVIEGLNVQLASGDHDHHSALQTGNLIIGYPMAQCH